MLCGAIKQKNIFISFLACHALPAGSVVENANKNMRQINVQNMFCCNDGDGDKPKALFVLVF